VPRKLLKIGKRSWAARAPELATFCIHDIAGSSGSVGLVAKAGQSGLAALPRSGYRVVGWVFSFAGISGWGLFFDRGFDGWCPGWRMARSFNSRRIRSALTL